MFIDMAWHISNQHARTFESITTNCTLKCDVMEKNIKNNKITLRTVFFVTFSSSSLVDMPYIAVEREKKIYRDSCRLC